jgi:hypothetical protein
MFVWTKKYWICNRKFPKFGKQCEIFQHKKKGWFVCFKISLHSLVASFYIIWKFRQECSFKFNSIFCITSNWFIRSYYNTFIKHKKWTPSLDDSHLQLPIFFNLLFLHFYPSTFLFWFLDTCSKKIQNPWNLPIRKTLILAPVNINRDTSPNIRHLIQIHSNWVTNYVNLYSHILHIPPKTRII